MGRIGDTDPLPCNKSRLMEAVKLGTISAASGAAHIILELPRGEEIGSSETLCEPVVDGLEAGGGLGDAGLVAQGAGGARRRSQLPWQKSVLGRPIEPPSG